MTAADWAGVILLSWCNLAGLATLRAARAWRA